ncbi:uncharacterized protein TNIN_243561 [Trichonephila inaurata madagascariensis]|uniref:Uncharacterized protein n=1 Tax=Trichonephila inaurata madagascariensis TaxID=2747483 RepID=A0A8X6YQM5_9ARAC|nr:uncharacterized protein TNIN_243561 [Trichonephila inaurata madagascariensis]
MSRDLVFRHLMQKLFAEAYLGVLDSHQDNNKDCDPRGYLTKNLLNLFPQVFKVLEFVIYETWYSYVEVSRETIVSSPEKYISNMMMMCNIEVKRYKNIYDRFLIVLSLVILTSKMVSDFTRKPFHRMNPQILIVVFENMLRKDFYRRGGWKRLENYILNSEYTEYYYECLPYKFIIKDFPEHLKQRIRHSFSPKVTFYCEIGNDGRRFRHLTSEVMSYVDPSLLSELNSPELNEEQWIPKEVEESDSNTATMLEDSRTKVPDELDLSVCCSEKVEELEWKLQNLLSIFELLDTK